MPEPKAVHSTMCVYWCDDISTVLAFFLAARWREHYRTGVSAAVWLTRADHAQKHVELMILATQNKKKKNTNTERSSFRWWLVFLSSSRPDTQWSPHEHQIARGSRRRETCFLSTRETCYSKATVSIYSYSSRWNVNIEYIQWCLCFCSASNEHDLPEWGRRAKRRRDAPDESSYISWSTREMDYSSAWYQIASMQSKPFSTAVRGNTHWTQIFSYLGSFRWPRTRLFSYSFATEAVASREGKYSSGAAAHMTIILASLVEGMGTVCHRSITTSKHILLFFPLRSHYESGFFIADSLSLPVDCDE